MLSSARKTLGCALLAACVPVFAQIPPVASGAVGGNGSISRLKGVMEAVRKGDTSQLPEVDRKAVESAQKNSAKAAALVAPKDVVDGAIKKSVAMEELTREAFVAALPPRDRELGRSVMFGDNLVAGGGKLYYFVSRSMPLGVLKAYALDALYTGGTLVVKGIRRGDTIKEYMDEVISEFNKADGQVLAGTEINPNLFDMFGVTVVPTVVWTNRAGLDEGGSGCQWPDVVPMIEMEGPNGDALLVEKPVCAQLPSAAYYKISGVLNTNYVLDRFESAGADKESIKKIRASLASFRGNVNQAATQDVGNAMVPIEHDLRIDAMPPHVLLGWEDALKTSNVRRSAFGPAFGDIDDDAEYRKELKAIIARGLGRPAQD